MSSHRIIRNFTLRKRSILKRTDPSRLVMRLCENCNHLKKKCRVNTESDKCIECIRLKRKCDLIFSMIAWKRVKNERDRVFNELKTVYWQMQKMMTEITRLQIQFEFLEKKEQTMIERKFRNIAKLEENEKRFNESTLNDFLFDVFFERIKISSDFDWLNSSIETVAEASDSSWNFPLILKCSRYVRNLFT